MYELFFYFFVVVDFIQAIKQSYFRINYYDKQYSMRIVHCQVWALTNSEIFFFSKNFNIKNKNSIKSVICQIRRRLSMEHQNANSTIYIIFVRDECGSLHAKTLHKFRHLPMRCYLVSEKATIMIERKGTQYKLHFYNRIYETKNEIVCTSTSKYSQKKKKLFFLFV